MYREVRRHTITAPFQKPLQSSACVKSVNITRREEAMQNHRVVEQGVAVGKEKSWLPVGKAA